MIKRNLLALSCAGIITACDVPNLTSSGGGEGNPALAAAETPAPESDTPAGSTETTTEAPRSDTPQTGAQDEPPQPPPPVVKSECGVGRYAFRTDSDGKFHFDAHFEPGGVIRYNFSVQPNRGKWRISGNTMIFNGPFAAGASNHVSHWAITSRAADCRVLQFRGKSYGQADVTASRL